MRLTNKWTAVCFGLTILASAQPAIAYDAETHALIAYRAYGRSALSQTGAGSLVTTLGLDRLDIPTPFNTYWQAVGSTPGPLSYYDTTSASGFDRNTTPRQPNEYERCQMQHLADTVVAPNVSWLTGDPMLSGSRVTFFPIENWLMRGDLREDDLSPLLYNTIASDKCGQPDNDPYGQIVRVFNHFYDPIHNVGNVGAKSVDWALGYVDSFATPPVVDSNRRNHFTYADARENMWRALTGETGRSSPPYTAAAHAADAQERLYRWATTFRSLGDVIHLLQDGASPQHVRNDIHSPIGTSKEQQAFEKFTNARVLNQTANDSGPYVRGFFLRSAFQNAVPPIVLGSTPYPIPTFATALHFYTTRLPGDGSGVLPDSRYGMMDYANRSFFTGGTLPGMSGNTFLRPPTPVDGTQMYTQSQVPCVLSSAQGNSWRHDLKCTHMMHAVPDSIAPGYVDTLPPVDGAVQFTQPPLAAFSTFTIAACPPSQCRYTVGLEELETMANLAIPRAIGYSAGLINFFFRGSIQVDAPQDGLFGLVDHALAHTVDADGYPHCTSTVAGAAGEPNFCTANSIYGFTKIRLKIRNSTTAITESGTTTPVIAQSMLTTLASPGPTDPQIVAVARYHRNLCYQATLQGEAVVDYQGTVTENDCAAGKRSKYQEISVSAPAVVTATNLNGASSTPVTFDFSNDPIPINATDLFIQVVYRGQLGNEKDGIAVGMIDVREPSYVTLWNNSDYAGCNGAWATGNGNGCTFTNGIGKGINSAYICIGGQSVYSRFNTGGNGNIFLGKYVRLAALLDNQSHTTKASLNVGTEMAAVYIHKTIAGQTRQDSVENETVQSPYVPDAMFIKRGMIGSFRPIPFYMIIGADPQPANDTGALDVGALTPAYATVLPDTGGTMSFPNTPPAPIAGCTN
jgi:hypothetical protein